MSSIRNIVKVMNFHSLLRIDKARRQAEKFFKAEEELTQMIYHIYYNKNLALDKKMIKPNPKAPILRIYIGNDYGFCGDFNHLINHTIREDEKEEIQKIIIGSKMIHPKENVLLYFSKEDFEEQFPKIEHIVEDGIKNGTFSKVDIVYNHYYNTNHLQYVGKTVFPLPMYDDITEVQEDFTIETNVTEMLIQLFSLYICYEIRIAEMNSYASENVMRQRITRESLHKIDELETIKQRKARKKKKKKDFDKLIDNFKRIRS